MRRNCWRKRHICMEEILKCRGLFLLVVFLLSQGFTNISQDQAGGRSFIMNTITKPVKKPVAVSPEAGFNNVQ